MSTAIAPIERRARRRQRCNESVQKKPNTTKDVLPQFGISRRNMSIVSFSTPYCNSWPANVFCPRRRKHHKKPSGLDNGVNIYLPVYRLYSIPAQLVSNDARIQVLTRHISSCHHPSKYCNRNQLKTSFLNYGRPSLPSAGRSNCRSHT